MILRYATIGVTLVSIGLALGWSTERERHASTKAEWAAERASSAEASRQASENFRLQEQRWVAQREERESAHAKRIAELESRLDAVAAERNRLRGEIDDFAAGPSNTSEDSISAARQRAETLGVLLGQADERAERDARELEALNGEKRLLLEAWPK